MLMESGMHNGISNLISMEAEKGKGLEKLSEQLREGDMYKMCNPEPVIYNASPLSYAIMHA